MLAEDHVAGASVGPTLRAVIADQFERLRDGDRFWFERTFSGTDLKNLEHTTLADVIRRNTGLTNLQSDVFFFRASVSGTVFADTNQNHRQDRVERPLAGQTVELIDGEDGSVVASTVTDARGRYLFNVMDGLRTGTYTVMVVAETASAQPLARRSFAVTRGEQFIKAIDLGVATTTSPTGGRHSTGSDLDLWMSCFQASKPRDANS